MTGIMLLVMGLIILPSILIIVIPLIDKILNVQFLGFFNEVISNLDLFIGTNQVNYILIILGLVFFLIFMRFLFRTISVFSQK